MKKMKNKDVNLKVANYIIQWGRETGGIEHDTHAYIFPVAAALAWRDVNVGLAAEYHPGCGVNSIKDDEEDTQMYYDDFSDWTMEEMEALSIAFNVLWDAATEREENR